MATTHSPYAVPPPAGPAAPGAAAEAPTPCKAKKRSPPAISRPSFSHTMAVLREVQAVGAAYFAVPRLGWRVLQRLWRVTPADFDAVALAHLALQPEALQQHVLLMLATTGVRKVQNLSAFLSCLVQDACERTPVCLGFIAGCCGHDTGCPFTHPTMVKAWKLLQDRWQVGWLDFDYLVLNTLLLKPAAKQDEVLRSLARMKLKSVRNPSALLASIVGQCSAAPDPMRRAGPAPGAAARRARRTGHRDPAGAAAGAADEGPRRPEPEVSPSEDGTVGPSEGSDASLEDGGHRPSFSSLASSQRGSLCWGDLEAEVAPPASPATPLDLPVPYAPGPSPPPQPEPTGAAPPPARPEGPSPAPTAPAPGPAPQPGAAAPGPLTARVVQLLRERATLAPPAAGWGALQCLWGVGPAHFEPAALALLGRQPPLRQEHILLSIAAMDLCQPHHDLSTLVHAAVNTAPHSLCWRHLAGLCPTLAACPCGFRHPSWSLSWEWLHQQGVSHLAVDYAVLNVLLQLPPPLQDRILAELCRRLPHAAPLPSKLLLAIMEQVLWRPH